MTESEVSKRWSPAVVGKLEEMPVREVWEMEEHHLTPWLAENLDLLERELHIQLELTEREHRVGGYELDLLLRADDGRVVIVENQFGGSNHGHLGQVLTYAGGTKADVIVWLAESFRDEHLAALQWLNESTTEGVDFFAITIAAVRIGDSLPAPILEVAARPNEWVRSAARESREARQQPPPDRDWDWYSTEAGHSARKVSTVQTLVERLEAASTWRARKSKNQITFWANRSKVAGIEFYLRDSARVLISNPVPDSASDLGRRYLAIGRTQAAGPGCSALPTKSQPMSRRSSSSPIELWRMRQTRAANQRRRTPVA